MSATPGMPEYGGLADRIERLESQVARLSRARSIQSTSLDGGTFRVKNGGTIEIMDGSGNVLQTFDVDGLKAYETDGSTLAHLDGSKLRFNRGDGSRQLEITPAGGLKFYESDGTTVITTLDGDGLQVGTDVVIDSTGLKIGGILQPEFWPFVDGGSAANESLGTSATTTVQIVIDPPDWVNTLHLVSIGRVQMSNTSGGGQNLTASVVNDVGGASEQQVDTVVGTHSSNSPATNSAVAANVEDITLSPAGRTVTIELEAAVNTGSNSSNAHSLSVIGFGTRV